MNEITPSNRQTSDDWNGEERYLAQISALIDGELESDLLLDTLDFLVQTPEAREFYGNARAVDGLFQGLGRKPATVPPSRDLWQRISEGARQAGSAGTRPPAPKSPDSSGTIAPLRSPRSLAGRAWLALAAAVLLGAFGLISLRLWQSRPHTIDPAVDSRETLERFSEVTVGGNEGEMTDARFLVLATELLEADRRYRREMLALMSAVEETPLAEDTTQEARYGDDLSSGEGGEPTESDPFRSRPRIERW